jgi:NAD(P)-dependent dehydrogenase (short-subunit alcohol dehydrogenase family)
VVVHAAGIFLVGPIEEHTVELLDRQFDVNVRAPYVLTLAALPHLGSGSSVIFISSVAGQIGFAGAAAYCISKGAVEQMVKAFGVELAAKGIRVNGIAPGNVRTAMNEDLLANPDYEAAMIAMTPLAKIGEVGEIAPLAVLMASPAGGFMAGACFLVDGGLAAQ